MSITFFVTNSPQVMVDNELYNPMEPEDPIFNPKRFKEPIYPEMNVCNAFACILLENLGLYDDNRSGTVKDLDKFIKQCLDLSNTSTESYETIQEKNTVLFGRTNIQMRLYYSRLLDMAVFARRKNETIGWA